MSESAQPEIFDFGERLGLFLTVEVASLSAASTSLLLLYILYKETARNRAKHAAKRVDADIHQHHSHDSGKGYSTESTSVDEEHRDVSGSTYFRNLMMAELIQAIGGLLNIKWIAEASVIEGPLCTAQGICKQAGDVGVAMTSLTIAIHTFLVLVLRWHIPPQIRIFSFVIPTPIMIVGLIWLFIILALAIPAGLHHNAERRYYGNTGYWCWISDTYPKERIGLEYFWLWAAAFLQIIIYVILALVLRGAIIIEKGKVGFKTKHLDSRDRRDSDSYGGSKEVLDEEAKAVNARAMRMLFYPLVYIITVFPVSIVRWLGFSGSSVPPGATFFASVLFSSSGLLNVILYSVTRPGVIQGPKMPTDNEKGNNSDADAQVMQQLRKSGSAQQMNGGRDATASSISGSYVERRRTGSLRSATGSAPLSPVQRALGRLPDLGDEDEEDAELGSSVGRGYAYPPIGYSNASRLGSAGGGVGASPGHNTAEPPSRAQPKEDLGRLPDSDDEGIDK